MTAFVLRTPPGSDDMMQSLTLFGVLFGAGSAVLHWLDSPGILRQSILLLVYGATFGVWGSLVGAFVAIGGGTFGLPQSILTGYILFRLTKCPQLGLACPLALIPAWILALAVPLLKERWMESTQHGKAEFDSVVFVAAGIWNIVVLGAMTHRFWRTERDP